MPDVVISEFMSCDAVDSLAADFDVLYEADLVDRPNDLLAAVADARALIVRNRTQVRGRLLDAAFALQVVGRLGVGLDNIDLEACERRNIKVKPATGANGASVAEYVIAMALVLLRGGYASTESVVEGAWPRRRCIGREAMGKTIGFIGFGSIARETARRAQALGMRVAACDPYLHENDPALVSARLLELNGLLKAADVISLHVPLTEATRGMIDKVAIAAMKDGAIVINTARGGILDEEALCEALKAGRLGGAALDVFEAEPVSADGGAKFSGVPNVILTPHIGGVTEESNLRVSDVTAQNVRSVLEQN